MASYKVSVGAVSNALRLRWTYLGKRQTLYLGAPDTPTWRKVAEGKAAIIADDLRNGTYDTTKQRYLSTDTPEPKRLTVVNLFRKFKEHRSCYQAVNSGAKYKALSGHLAEHFGDRPAGEVNEAAAEAFRDYLANKKPKAVGLSSQAAYLALIKGAWVWGTKRGLVEGPNPWGEVVGAIRVPSKTPQAFTLDELQAILAAFRGSSRYSHYSTYVEFLFGTGVRLGEANGLRWGQVSRDCTKVTISQSASRGVQRDTTKTGSDREFKLSPRITQLLLTHRPQGWRVGDLVFPGPNGSCIDDHNFRNRAWKRCLENAGVPYLKPYATRATFITLSLSQGRPPAAVAQACGHNLATMIRRYVAYIEHTPENIF
jgi:integrase